MAYYGKEMWKDFQSIFPEHTKTPLRVVIWSILILIDLVIGGFVAFSCGFADNGYTKTDTTLFVIVLAAVAIGLFTVETVIWKAILRIFR